MIYIGSLDSYLYAVKPDGKRQLRYRTSDEVHSTAAIGTDGTIYVGTDDSYLYAIKPDGKRK